MIRDYYRFATGLSGFTSRVTREYRRLVLKLLGQVDDLGQFYGNSRLVDELLGYFPLSVSFGDSLHVIYEGIIPLIFKLLQKHHPKKYELLENITLNLRMPREEDSYNLYLGGKMKAKDWKYFFFNYAETCLILSTFPEEMIHVVVGLRRLIKRCEDKEENVKRLFNRNNFIVILKKKIINLKNNNK